MKTFHVFYGTPKGSYCVHRSLPLALFVAIVTSLQVFLKVLSSHPRLGLGSFIFISLFPTQILSCISTPFVLRVPSQPPSF
jgi:hypothetical protein